jgi:Cdc6-like AAA superfamily ATPase
MIYVYGTPANGKTVLFNLLYQRLDEQYPHIRVIPLAQWPVAMSHGQCRQYLELLLHHKLSKIDSMQETVLLVDEAQTTKKDLYFWNSFIKNIVQDGHGPIRVGLFASYGSAGSAPVEYPYIALPILSSSSRVELEWHGTQDDEQKVGLYLSKDEADEIFDRPECSLYVYVC